MTPIINRDRSVIVSCDVDTEKHFQNLVKATTDIEGIGGYKVGLTLGIEHGIKQVVKLARTLTDLPIIYDHQKGANDIPAMGKKFAGTCKRSGVNAVILFPFTGPITQREWIRSCFDEGLGVLVGAHMTHEKFLESEGGSISDSALSRIYTLAAKEGVRHFVVPGNRPEYVEKYKALFESLCDDFHLYAPGFITQGGSISDCGAVAGSKWHAIVGSAIYDLHNQKEMRQSALRLAGAITTK